MSDVATSERRKPVVTADDAPIRVLHVDDERDFVDLAATWIERAREQITVLTETSASDALDRLESDHVDCIVSDYDMPGMDGLTFLEAVREEYPQLPFILYTGKGSEEIASEAISAGVTDYLQKEVGTDQYEVLANRIEHAVAQQRTESALAESERVLSTLMSNVPGMVYRCRNERGWPMTFVSEGSIDLVGYAPEEIIDGSYGTDVIHSDDQDRVWNEVQTAVEAGRPFEVEYRVETKEGETRWAWEQGRAIDTDDDGTVILEGVVTDITERKRSERELQTERDRLSALFENSGAAIVDYEFEGDSPIIRDVNSAFEETFGYERDAVIGEDLDDLITPPERRDRAEDINQRGKAGERLLNEVKRRTADGLRDFRVRSIPLKPGEYGDEGWVVYTDITEQKEREAQLKKAEQRYRRLAEQNLFGIYIVQDGTIRYVNPETADIFGYEPAEMVDELTAFDIVAERDHETIRENMRKRQDGDTGELQYELTGVRKDGTEVELEVHSGIIEYEGEEALLGAVIDITERKEREAALRHERNRARKVLETAGSMMVIIDRDGTVSYINQHGCEVLGYEEVELLGTDWFETCIPEDEREAAREAFESIIEHGEEFDVRMGTVVTADGTERIVKWNNTVMEEDGTPTGTLSAGTDITDRIRREESLEQYSAFLNQFYRISTRSDIDFDRKLQELLESGCEFLAFDIGILSRVDDGDYHIRQAHDEVGSISAGDTFALENTYCEQTIEQTQPHGFASAAEADLVEHPCYEVFDLRSYLGVAVHVDGELYGTLNFSSPEPREQKITELDRTLLTLLSQWISFELGRRERERELEQYERMLNTVGDAVYILDRDREFVAVNEALTELTGYSRAELLGASANMVIREQDAEEARELRQKLREPGTDVVTLDLVLQTRDGDTIPAEVRFRELTDGDGNQVGTAGVARDITDRRERQQQLRRQNERLEEFAHLVSHDLKGPLNVARTRTELLAETGDDVHFEKAQQAHDRMADIVTDVLDLARQGQTVRDPEPVPLADVAHQAWTAVSELEASLSVETDAKVVADRSRLQSLLENLFRNAIDHVGDGVSVEVGILPSETGFYVADDGPGIPPEDRAQVFEAGHSTSEDGTGFGLSIVETIAGAHGWSVFLTSGATSSASLDGAQFSITGVTVQSTD